MKARVSRISAIYPHPNADRVVVADVDGVNVVVAKGTTPGEVGVFFEPGLEISEQIAEKAGLLVKQEGKISMSKPVVKAINIRGVRSSGLWLRAEFFPELPEVGTEFTHLGDMEICKKYLSIAEKNAITFREKVESRTKSEDFPKHTDTEKATPLSLHANERAEALYITEKIHGTSFRVGYVKVDKYRPKALYTLRALFNKYLSKVLGFSLSTEYSFREYEFVVGSRNKVIRDDTTGFYGDESWRIEVVQHLQTVLEPGEIIYGEITGFTPRGTLIMPSHDMTKLKGFAPEFRKYPDTITYTYGENSTQLWVYRITRKIDGEFRDLSYFDMQRRVEEINQEIKNFGKEGDLLLNLPMTLCVANCNGDSTVPTLRLDHLETTELSAGFMKTLENFLEEIDLVKWRKEHISEGVVLRFEKDVRGKYAYSLKNLKHKFFEFKLLEGIAKTDDSIDLEDIS